eukprot:m.160232 g.160232  ORF g.160232 m.160232 type:complete len:59 (-) comp53025_c0_seq2:120-296(-)
MRVCPKFREASTPSPSDAELSTKVDVEASEAGLISAGCDVWDSVKSFKFVAVNGLGIS